MILDVFDRVKKIVMLVEVFRQYVEKKAVYFNELKLVDNFKQPMANIKWVNVASIHADNYASCF